MIRYLSKNFALKASILIGLGSCVSTKSTTSDNSSSQQGSVHSVGLQDENLVHPQGRVDRNKSKKNRKPVKKQRKKRVSSPGKGDVTKRTRVCSGLIEKIQTPLKELAKSFPSARVKMKSNTQAAMTLGMNPADCASKEKQMNLIKNLVRSVEVHSNRVGIILPLTGSNGYSANLILDGMKTFANAKGLEFSDTFVVRDSAGNETLTKEVFAELFFNEEISAVIGGFTQVEKAVLESLADRLLVPTVILAPSDSEEHRSQQIYNVFPNEQDLTDLIAKTSRSKKFRSVALLYPVGGGALINKMKKSLKNEGIRLGPQASYIRGNYQSMEKAARTIFQVLPHQRRSELSALIRQEKIKAEKEGYGFNQNMVFLPPAISFEGVFIPDDFKTIRHFAQIFKFLSVEKDKLVMIGHHQWRSMGLIQPYDEFMEKSFFVDFVGSYRSLPKGISARTIDGEYFVNANNARRYDFNIIGYHAARILVKALSEKKVARRKIARVLETLNSEDDGYFGAGLVFSQNHTSRWPAFAFEIMNKKIKLIDYAEKQSPAH